MSGSPGRAPGVLRLLTIAGSDSGGGAGIQADLKTFAAHGGFGMSAITAVTVQNTLGVRDVVALRPGTVADQIDAVLEDLGADAIKVGMLADADVVEAVASRLRAIREGKMREVRADVPIVVDPVMVAASGDPLLTADAVAALRDRLLPLATISTPNLPEAERLAGAVAANREARERLTSRLAAMTPAVLVKGGHADEDPMVDLLWDGARLHAFSHPRLQTRAAHGTGCTLSSAIAARLGRGETLVGAVGGAIEWLHRAIALAPELGHGNWPIDALWKLRASEGVA